MNLVARRRGAGRLPARAAASPGASPPDAAGRTVPMASRWTGWRTSGAGRLLYGTLPELAPNEKIIVSLPYTVHSTIEAGHAYDFPGSRVEPQVLRPGHRAPRAGAASARAEVGVTAPALVRPRFEGRTTRMTDSARWLGRLMSPRRCSTSALVVLVPFLMAIGYSFSTVTIGTSTPRFVGLENFRSALQDPASSRRWGTPAIFALVSQTLVIVLASILAIALSGTSAASGWSGC